LRKAFALASSLVLRQPVLTQRRFSRGIAASWRLTHYLDDSRIETLPALCQVLAFAHHSCESVGTRCEPRRHPCRRLGRG
jgi:hypothetical protein